MKYYTYHDVRWIKSKIYFPVLVRQQVLREHSDFHGLGMTTKWMDGDQLDE